MSWIAIFKDASAIYKKAGFLDRLHILGRVWLGNFPALIEATPSLGRNVLDFGCGHGIYLNLIRKHKKCERGIGIDLDSSRINIAADSALPDLAFLCRSLESVDGSFTGVVMGDVLHLVPYEIWPQIFGQIRDKLDREGKVVIKTVFKKKNVKYVIGWVHEFLMTRILKGVSSIDGTLYFLSQDDWNKFLIQQGFAVESTIEIPSPFYNHVILICRKKC